MCLRSALLDVTMLLGCTVCCHPDSLAPAATFDLAKLLPDAVTSESSVSVEFLTDKTLALCLHSADGRCRVYTFEWADTGFHSLSAGMNIETGPRESLIHRAGPDHFLSTGFAYSGSAVYSASLQQKQQSPHVDVSFTSASGEFAATSGTASWTVYQLVPTVQQLRQGSGALLSVSDEMLAIRRQDKIQIETHQGKELGFFAVKPETKCFSDVTLLNTSTLFLTDCGRFYIADFSGKRLANVTLPSGDLDHTGISDGGARILFDYATRHVSSFKIAGKLAQTVASAGVGAPEEWDNGEAVRVIDTKNGHTCFDWHASLSANLHEVTAYSHSDLSPSGRFVAIANGTKLSFFSLPTECAAP
jgi:hypothetical protein